MEKPSKLWQSHSLECCVAFKNSRPIAAVWPGSDDRRASCRLILIKKKALSSILCPNSRFSWFLLLVKGSTWAVLCSPLSTPPWLRVLTEQR